MFWRRAESTLTADERWSYKYHRARLLSRHFDHLTLSLIRCLEANASRLARHPEVQTREWGLNMGGKRAAKATHASIRAKGKTPGGEGRDPIAWNRVARKRDEKEGRGWRVGQTESSQYL